MMCTVISAISRVAGESFAIFLLPIALEFQTDRAALTGVYSTYMVALGVMSPIAGTIFDRLGARLCYSVGLAVFGFACLLASQVSALWQLYLLTGLGGAIGASMIGMLPASSLVSLSTTATTGSSAGTYAITASATSTAPNSSGGFL